MTIQAKENTLAVNNKQGKNIMQDLDVIYSTLVEYEIATEEEIQLVTNINGFNLETFEGVIYVRTGLNSFDQLCEDLGIELD